MGEVIDDIGAGWVVLVYLLVYLPIWALTELAARRQRREQRRQQGS